VSTNDVADVTRSELDEPLSEADAKTNPVGADSDVSIVTESELAAGADVFPATSI